MNSASKAVPDLTIRYDFNKISKLTEKERSSHTIVFHDVPWYFFYKLFFGTVFYLFYLFIRKINSRNYAIN